MKDAPGAKVSSLALPGSRKPFQQVIKKNESDFPRRQFRNPATPSK